ncbi:hypothetical protein Dsin_010831 [Dipteronia sinensis]|uniref:Zinc knuckle CX2CX4HX4C domain-containing protein n=1 Tax=Dipteronia sinensis TaxID=43782 RepID=A0AAE0ED19_9ROSI|nr:hypothetical protein Dsin_010831 [Dipteronia sinensis]
MRVKVRIDIFKPLKHWLRLKLGKHEEVTMLSLKYERLPEFCYACGRIGQGIKECSDEEARRVVLEGSPTKYGSWLKATIPEKVTLKPVGGDGPSQTDAMCVEGPDEEWAGPQMELSFPNCISTADPPNEAVAQHIPNLGVTKTIS